MKKLLALVLAMVMTLGLATVGASAKSTTYSDEADIKYNEAVDVMTEIGVLGGDENGFRPKDELKRSEGAKIITYLMLGKEAAEQMTGGGKFSDVPASHWAAGYIEYLAVEGIVGGIGDGKFDPDGTLTTAQFAKMLLGALGYDANIEGFGGPDWMINVQALAKTVGIFDSNTGAIATSNIKREEAALYAFNMIQKPLVEYENKGSTMSVNGATISFGASKANFVYNTGKDNENYRHIDNTTFNNGIAAGQDIIEFAEEYFTKLIKYGDEIDDFGRKSTKWVFNGKEIGSYAASDELIYTTAVTLGQIYKDLGLTNDTSVASNKEAESVKNGPTAFGVTYPTAYSSWYFVDGVASDSEGVDIAHANPAAGDHLSPLVVKKESTTKIGGNGAETYVYYDNGKVRICVVNWYAGDVVGVYAATAKKAATIDIAGRGVAIEDTKNTSGSKETTGFSVDDVVIYTASWKNKAGIDDTPAIGEVKKAEVVEGELNSFDLRGREALGNTSTTGSVTIAGKKYTYSAKVADTPDGTFLRNGIKLEIVLDKYGYAIDVGDYGVQNYAVVVKTGVAGAFGKDPVVNLLLTDGTTTGAVYLSTSDGDHKANATTGSITYEGTTEFVQENDIVTYTKTSNGEYKLNYKTHGAFYDTSTAEVNVSNLITSGSYQLYPAAFGTGASSRTNGKTVFLFKDSTGNYRVYNGIKDVPTVQIVGAGRVYLSSYSEKNNAAQVVYVNLDTPFLALKSNDTIFVKFPASVGKSVFADGESYYALPAWVNGESQTINMNAKDGDAEYGNNGSTHYVLYRTMAVNSKGIATLGMAKEAEYTSVALKNKNIGIGGATYSIADNIKVFEIRDDDVIVSSVNAIPTSDSTKLWYNVDSSNNVNYIYWTKDAAKTYSASSITASGMNPNTQLGAFINAHIGDINKGETMSIIMANAVIEVPIDVPEGVNLVFSGSVTFRDGTYVAGIASTMSHINGMLKAQKLTIGTDNNGTPAGPNTWVALGAKGSVTVTNNLIVEDTGHLEVPAGASVTTWNNDGEPNDIGGLSLVSRGTINLTGRTNLTGKMELLGGKASFSMIYITGKGNNKVKLIIGGTGSAVLELAITGLSASTSSSSDEELIEIATLASGSTIDVGTLSTTGHATTDINAGSAGEVNITNISGTGAVTVAAGTNIKVTANTNTHVTDNTGKIPSSSERIEIDLADYLLNGGAVVVELVNTETGVRTTLGKVTVDDDYTGTESNTSAIDRYIRVSFSTSEVYLNIDDTQVATYYIAVPATENTVYGVTSDSNSKTVTIGHSQKKTAN